MIDSFRIVSKVLDKCQDGVLAIALPSGVTHRFGQKSRQPTAYLNVNNHSFFRRLAIDGDIGFGDSYVDGDWDSPDIAAVVSWFLRNHDTLTSRTANLLRPLRSKLSAISHYVGHRLRANTVRGSKRNIHAHYDIGNDFYQTFLDPSMSYSSGYYAREDASLEEAQLEKLTRLCDKLQLCATDKVLDIGCGWGFFATFIAENYGCEVHAVTISQAQHDTAIKRVRELGLEHLVTVEIKDYRELDGCYDKIVSVEMLEAVGHENLTTFYDVIHKLLHKDGLAAVQVILAADHRYDSYRRRSDWIRQRIFPGGHLPSLQALLASKKDRPLSFYHLETFGPHYAKTLHHWAERFVGHTRQVQELGFDESFCRSWMFYLKSCQALFDERHIELAQCVIGRPNSQSYKADWHRDSQPLSLWLAQKETRAC